MDIAAIPKFSITTSEVNKDCKYTKEQYLAMVAGFESTYPAPTVERIDGRIVVREDLLAVGSKARFGECLIAACEKDTIVYVQPRYGFAAISLVDLCKKYNKKLILFMPSSKELSDHQAYSIEHGAEPRFHRIAAMKNLNILAEKWAANNNGFFIPLGLQHPLVTAMIIRTAVEISERGPEAFWTAFSTGVLNRALQIAWPNSDAYGVAVSRNIQPGEKGKCMIVSSHLYFGQDATIRPPFPSASNYDAKVWEYVLKDELFWNVAGEITTTLDKSTINSQRNWKQL